MPTHVIKGNKIQLDPIDRDAVISNNVVAPPNTYVQTTITSYTAPPQVPSGPVTVNINFDPTQITPQQLNIKAGNRPIKMVHLGPDGNPLGEVRYDAQGRRISALEPVSAPRPNNVTEVRMGRFAQPQHVRGPQQPVFVARSPLQSQGRVVSLTAPNATAPQQPSAPAERSRRGKGKDEETNLNHFTVKMLRRRSKKTE